MLTQQSTEGEEGVKREEGVGKFVSESKEADRTRKAGNSRGRKVVFWRIASIRGKIGRRASSR